MRLQNLTIIFVVIVLPVIILLSVFIKFQVDTINLKAQYDGIFLSATYDMMSALELNNNNNKYSAVSDSLIRDIEGSINSFSTTFGNSTSMFGVSKKNVMDFVPAIMFGLYDGYYIYTPSKNEKGVFEHTLKPYVYYTKEYTNGTGSNQRKMIINFSLDNHVTVFFSDKVDNRKYESRSGFLEPIATSKTDKGIYIEPAPGHKQTDLEKDMDEDTALIYYNGYQIEKDERLTTKVFENTTDTQGNVANSEFDSLDAYDYCLKAYRFTKWYYDILDRTFGTGHDSTKEILKISVDNQALPQYESEFNQEKRKVIQSSIEENLIQSMELYKRKSDIDFKMPQFTVLDWEQITQNICVVAFLQGMPVGMSIYNNYVILPSTDNNFFVNEKNLYYVGYGGDADTHYHRLGCEHLKGDYITRIQQKRIF